MFIAIAVIAVVIGAAVALVLRDMKRHPERDWHAGAGAL